VREFEKFAPGDLADLAAAPLFVAFYPKHPVSGHLVSQFFLFWEKIFVFRYYLTTQKGAEEGYSPPAEFF
jgi:hypothetical protein